MRNLILTKKNDVHLVIDADEDVRRDLGEHFTFSVPGFKFMPAYRSRHWDGKIRLFSYTNGQIYTGLYPYILNWCKENDIEVVDRTDIKDANVDDKLVDSFINKLNIPLEEEYKKENNDILESQYGIPPSKLINLWKKETTDSELKFSDKAATDASDRCM